MSELESLGMPAGLAGVSIYAIKKLVDGLDRLFGPMADEVAEALRRGTAHMLRNVGRVAENANKKTSRELLDSGEIPFRAAMKILQEATTLRTTYWSNTSAASWPPPGRPLGGTIGA